MREKRDAFLVGALVLLSLLLLARFTGAGTESNWKESCIPEKPTRQTRPTDPELHWNPVTRGLMHI